MQAFNTEKRLIAALGIILVAGFLAVNITAYQISTQSVRQALVKNELPLTSNNIYSEIQASLLRPIYISSLMAHDTFLKDWMIGGEEDEEKVTKYLREIKNRYDVFSTFVVSDLTRRYYHFDGVLKEVSPSEKKDQWFFTMAAHPQDYRVELDSNEAAHNRLTIFVNHKIFDYDGRFIGVTGLGLDVATVSALIAHYKERFEREIYFVDRKGVIKSHGDNRIIDKMDINHQPGISAVANQILKGERGSLTYQRNGEKIFLRYRYIPELDWTLVVEQPEQAALASLRQAFYINLAISALITLLVLLISGYTVHRFQSRLETMARVDKLSGLFNRQFFEVLFENAANIARRQKHAISMLLFDIDSFKAINDQHGHQAGDRVIGEVADAMREQRRDTDILCRWGGDEFIVLLTDCDGPNARLIAEKLRQRIKNRVRLPDGGRPVTISIGTATHRQGEDLETLLARADSRLYAAKKGGRDQVADDDPAA